MATEAPAGTPTSYGEERREGGDHRALMTPADHAAEIVWRKMGGKRTANLDEVLNGYQEGVKREVSSLLDRLKGKRSLEQQAFLEGLLAQADAAASVWTEKFPIEDGPSQDQLEAGARTWLQGLSPQVLEGFRTLCSETASLVVIPPLPVPTLLELLKKGGTSSAIWWDYWKQVKTGSWKVGITDGEGDKSFEPAIYYENGKDGNPRTNEAMVAEYKRRFGEKGLGIMTPDGYVLSTARALAKGRVLDKQFYTAFERPNGEALLPHGFWGDDRLNLDGDGPGVTDDFLRCRPWVEGEMKF